MEGFSSMLCAWSDYTFKSAHLRMRLTELGFQASLYSFAVQFRNLGFPVSNKITENFSTDSGQHVSRLVTSRYLQWKESLRRGSVWPAFQRHLLVSAMLFALTPVPYQWPGITAAEITEENDSLSAAQAEWFGELEGLGSFQALGLQHLQILERSMMKCVSEQDGQLPLSSLTLL